MGFCVKTLHGVKSLHFFASLLFISSVLNTWTGTEGWSYHHSDVTMNWGKAREWCRAKFTDLVAIQNKEEISHLNSVLPKVTGYYWIGIRKMNGIWTWVGTNKTLTDKAKNWATNEPNGKKNNEDCVEIYIKRHSDAGKWNDESCLKKKTALCYTASCKEDSCVSGHGQCVENINTHTCSCFEGFYGDRCENVIKCKSEDVTTPDYGSVQCSNPNGNFSYDSQCEYFCEAGYILQGGSKMMRCTATTEWSSKPPSCDLVQCSELIKPNNGTMDCHHDSKGKYSYKSTCEFACQEGYTLGMSSSSTLFCEATGHWNDSQPSCEVIKCKLENITAPGHGSVRCSNPNGNLSFDSVCEYTCEEGYELKGSVKTRCEATAEWSNKPPTCEPVQCSELIKPNNGTMDCHHDTRGTFSYQTTCEFACQEGYTLGTSSSSTLFCEATGHWNDSQPSCEVIKCKPEDITAPGHGSVRCSNPNGNLSFDSVCEYTCEEGYELKGSVTTRCEATAEWTNKPPTCEPVQCSELIKPNNGTMDCHHDSKGKNSYKSTCEFACQEGYTLGMSSSSTLFCEATGHWNDSQPSCEVIKCKPEDITAPGHGSVRCSNPNGNLSFDSVCEYTCEEGYELKGSVTTRCEATAEWTNKPPTCEPVQCSELIKPNNGTMDCHHDTRCTFSYQTTCEFTCQEGYTLGTSSSSTLFCEATGHWNDSQPSCEDIKCKPEDITAPGHGSVRCSNPNGNLSFDSVCEYTCEEGYELKGSVTTRCEATAEWTNKPPTCEPVQCSELIKPNNGRMDCHHDSKGKNSYKSTCEFACQEGYTLGMSSSSTLFCEATGHWNDSQPSCEDIKCKPEDITAPGHGSVRCSNPNGNLSFDSVCEYTCEEGYELKGSVTTRCEATAEWTNKPPTCEPVQCSELIKPNNGTMDCHHDTRGTFSYQTTCEFTCQEGYTLGTSSSSTLFCEATGHWNDSQPSCEDIKCKPEDFTAPGHGSVRCSNPNGNLSFDSVCEYTCEEGYELKGSVTTRCEATAEWTNKPPTCEPVQCAELIKPNNGRMDCHHDSKGKNSYKSTCEFACQEGYTLGMSSSSTLFCEATGHWNDSQPSCEDIKCKPEDITAPGHGSVRCSNPNGNLSFDSVCEYTCEEGYELKGSVTTRCEATAEWTNKPPTCEPVQCSELIKPNNGTMDCHHDSKGKSSYKSTCEFTCQEGYTLGTSSSTTLFCEATGHWNDSQPSCEVIKCKLENITAPGHGSVRCSNPNGNLSFDSVCEYTCEEGYELKGSVTTRCEATAEWTNKPPTCEPVRCLVLIKPNKGTMNCHHDSKGKNSYKLTCEFACQEGYTLGTSSSPTLLCKARGHWNDSQPSCEVIKCKPEDITAPGHGSVRCSNPNGNLSFDSVCEYTCEEGYELKGSVTTRCEATAEWTNKPPTCEPVHCPVLEIPANGLLACNDFTSFSYGNKCSFSCEEGYRLQGASEISCTKTAEWSHDPPRCEAVECLQLHEPVNGHMNCTSPEPTFGTICIFSCHDGFQIQSNEMVMCNHNGNWSGEVTLCQVQPGPSKDAFKAAEVTLGVAATVGSSSLLLALWILRKLKKKANMFDLTSKSEIGDPPQVYKNSLDSLI